MHKLYRSAFTHWTLEVADKKVISSLMSLMSSPSAVILDRGMFAMARTCDPDFESTWLI